MTTIIAVPLPSLAAVRVTVSALPSASASVRVIRIDANGTRPVRVMSGTAPSGGVLTIIDYEPALLGPVTYSVTDTAGATVTVSTSLAGTVAAPVIHAIARPDVRASATLVSYGATRQSRSTVHAIPERQDTVANLGRMSMRSDRIEWRVSSYEQAAAIDAAHLGADVFMMRTPTYPGMDMYFIALSSTLRPESSITPTDWLVEVAYDERAWPTIPLSGTVGWTWNDLVAAFPTWDAVEAAYADWNAVAIGPL